MLRKLLLRTVRRVPNKLITTSVLSMLLVAFHADHVQAATTGSVTFSGYVAERNKNSFHLERDKVVAFGEVAGVRLHSSNPSGNPAHLSYAVFDTSNNLIGGDRNFSQIVPAKGESNTIVAFRLGEGRQQKVKVCARQRDINQETLVSKCFRILVHKMN